MSDATLVRGAIQPGEIAWSPSSALRPGPEMQTLKKFHFDCEWTGRVQPGGMGPGSPAMAARGRATFRPIMDGDWLVGDFEQEQFADGALLITWKAHYVVGWNPHEHEYKITYVDNNGAATLMSGWMEGNRFIIETSGESSVKFQMVWEMIAGGKVRWANRCSVSGGPWTLIEEYVCSPR
ncbi:MAG: DUF1579 family protein [Chloroflexota bacterium]